MSKSEFSAILIALSACIIWSGNFVIAQGVNEWITPMTLAFWRWLIAFLFVLPIGYKYVKRDWHLIKLQFKYVSGLYEIGNMFLYINEGTGTLGPKWRVNSVNEITHIHLKPTQ